MKILGLSAFHQDAAAAVVVDGKPVAAAQEALYSQTSRDASLPLKAARACLGRAGIKGQDLDRIVFYEKPLRRFERTLVQGLRAFPKGGRGFAREVSRWLGDRLWLKGQLMDEFGVKSDQVVFAEHAVSHASMAFFSSPFEEAAALVLHDEGEWTTTTLASCKGTQIEALFEAHLPHSLGLAASAFTQFLGFDPGADDEWLFDLASYGQPRFRSEVEALIGVDADGCPQLDEEAFPFGQGGGRLYSDVFEARFGPARIPGEPLRFQGDDARDADLAASVQAVLTERALGLAKLLEEKTGSKQLVAAGALTRNRGIASALLTQTGFDHVWIPAESSDAGAALGAALYIHHEEGDRASRANSLSLGESLGSIADREPTQSGVSESILLDPLESGRPVGWVRGALEFATHAVRRRLVLGDPRPADGRTRMLGALQRSEEFLACRLLVPAEDAAQWADLPVGCEESLALGQLVLPASGYAKEQAPGAVLPDGTVWLQAVSAEEDPALHKLVRGFGERTGVAALLVDTLCVRGGVTPRFDHEALEVLDRSTLEGLLAEDRFYSTSEVPA